jgi:uncharacterized protein (DUF58 family)
MLRGRLRAWFENRLPRSDSCTLTQRNLYILPTRAGWGFCVTLLVMLLAAINYQLNLGFALTFLLGGAALVSLHQTHGNLRRLALRVRAPAPVFAGEAATLELVLDNPGATRHGVGLGLHAQRRDGMAFCDVPAQGSTTVALRMAAPNRGRHALPTLLVETHFPLGLFRAWTVWRPACTLLVYPAPEQPAPPLPAALASADAELAARQTAGGGGGEFAGVRAYRPGDSQRQVVWKKMARSGELVSRDTHTSAAQALVLDYALAGARGASPVAEARLRRLSAWVLAADRQGLSYSLRLPGQLLPRAGGDAQRRAALSALALWQAPTGGAR